MVSWSIWRTYYLAFLPLLFIEGMVSYMRFAIELSPPKTEEDTFDVNYKGHS